MRSRSAELRTYPGVGHLVHWEQPERVAADIALLAGRGYRAPRDDRGSAAPWQPETLYLNTASYGLPPDAGVGCASGGARDWRGGRTSWEGWGDAPRAPVRLRPTVGVPTDVDRGRREHVHWSASWPQRFPDGARVLVQGDFTSVMLPFMAQGRGIEVRFVPVAPGG